MAERISAPSIISLEGQLGSGKTVLTKGIARGLGIKEEVTSPSYTIVSEYLKGNVPLYHIDLYRIEGEEELMLLGLEECLYGEGISVIEWGEKAKPLLEDAFIRIRFILGENDGRLLEIEGIDL